MQFLTIKRLSASLQAPLVLCLPLLLGACVSPVSAWRTTTVEAPNARPVDVDDDTSDSPRQDSDSESDAEGDPSLNNAVVEPESSSDDDSKDSDDGLIDDLLENTEAGEAPDLSSDAVEGAVSERVREERRAAFNPYVITAHKPNYFLPLSVTTGINEDEYRRNNEQLRDGLERVEVKFQISLKTQLNNRNLLFTNDSLSAAITLEAWWQLYSNDISSPFRETNYQPEIFYLVPLLWGPFGGSTAVTIGLEHQSNGQVQGLSRSWNRIFTTLAFEKGNFVASITPWYRIPEKRKETPDSPEGDDNPDILDFMGHGEITTGWRNSKYEYLLRLRGNPATGNGAVELSATFPLFGRVRGFVQAFSGYGESLIDYDFNQQRIGIGVALTNLY